jgi:hypothetical protein
VLEEGHFYPKFVIKWARSTGGAFWRSGGDPNRRRQDGPKEHFLCETCEDIFQVEEKAFAEAVFRPRTEDPFSPVDYDHHVARFTTSMLWRVVRRYGDGFQGKPRLHGPLQAAREEWRRFLLGETALQEFDRFHLFVTDVAVLNQAIPVQGFNRYMARALDGCIAENDVQTTCFVYAKLARFLFFGEILPFDESAWHGTRVGLQGGQLPVKQAIGQDGSGEFLISRARRVAELFNQKLTPRQAAKHRRAIPPPGTDAFRVWEADQTSDIDPFYPGLAKPGRNEPCPCGSGLKFKRCHDR